MNTAQPISACLINRKGGVCKTTSTINIGAELVRHDKRVLLVDCDPQASLTQSFFGSTKAERIPLERTVSALFDDNLNPRPEDVVHETAFENLFVVPSGEHLENYSMRHPETRGFLQQAFVDLVTEVSPVIDVVLFDCPPNLQLTTWAAATASQHVITPLIPEEYASQGIVHIKRFIEKVRSHTNANLNWMGLLLVMMQRNLAVHKAYESVLRDCYGQLVFETVIPLATVFKEAISDKTPLPLFKPNAAGGKAVSKLVEEVLERTNVEAPALREAA